MSWPPTKNAMATTWSQRTASTALSLSASRQLLGQALHRLLVDALEERAAQRGGQAVDDRRLDPAVLERDAGAAAGEVAEEVGALADAAGLRGHVALDDLLRLARVDDLDLDDVADAERLGVHTSLGADAALRARERPVAHQVVGEALVVG